jgi:hypothetical protein
MLLGLASALSLTRTERKEFLFAANGVANSNTYPVNRDPQEELQHIVNALRRCHLPCFANDVYGDIIATNSIMTDVLNVTDELREFGKQNPVAYNAIFFIMWPETGFIKMMSSNSNWRDLMTFNVQWFRRMSLRYRTSPHYLKMMKTIRQYPNQQFKETFRRFWEMAQIWDDLDGNMGRQYKYLHPKYGHLNYITTVAEEAYSCGEVFFITYIPADLDTFKVFHDLAKKHTDGAEGITVERFAVWPKPM